MRFTLKQKFIFTISAVIFAVAAQAALYWQFYSKVREERERLSMIEADIRSSESERAAARKIDEVVSSHEDEIRRIEKFFVDPERPVDFIESLENLARKTRNQVALSVESSPKDQHIFSFRVSADGKEEELVKYLRLLELLPYEIQVDEISLQRGQGQENPPGGSSEALAAPTHRLTLLIRVKTK